MIQYYILAFSCLGFGIQPKKEKIGKKCYMMKKVTKLCDNKTIKNQKTVIPGACRAYGNKNFMFKIL